MHIATLLPAKTRELHTETPRNLDRIALPVKSGLIFVLPADLLYCMSDGNYCRAFAVSGKNHYVGLLLNKLERQLSPHGFIRIHHQYIVNTRHILRYEKGDGGSLVLVDKTRLPVSRERKKMFLNWVKGLR